jgi:hypothetical protein
MVLPLTAAVVLYALQGVPRFLAAHLSGSDGSNAYWSDPGWIAADAAFVGMLALSLLARRSPIDANWSVFVALRASFLFMVVGAAGAAIEYTYGDGGTPFFFALVMSFAIYGIFWMAMALSLLCLAVAARLRSKPSRRS